MTYYECEMERLLCNDDMHGHVEAACEHAIVALDNAMAAFSAEGNWAFLMKSLYLKAQFHERQGFQIKERDHAALCFCELNHFLDKEPYFN